MSDFYRTEQHGTGNPKKGMKRQNYGHRWTDMELRQLIGKWMEGESLDALALHFKCTRHGINKQVLRMRREGIPLPRRAAGHVADRSNKPWTQAEVEFIVRRRNESATAEQMAVELGRSFLSVQGMIAKLRKEGIAVRMLGSGVRRLWSPESLREAIAGRSLVPQ